MTLTNTKTALYTIFFLITLSYTAQEKNQNLLTVGGGVGFAGYRGDLIGNSGESMFSNTKTYYNFGFERRFGNIIGIELAGLMGKLSYNENSLDSVPSFRNFEAKINQFGVNLIFNFDNDIVMKKQSPFSPYIAAGIHYFGFKSYTDLTDAKGRQYHYWDDGSIRTIAQNDPNAPETFQDTLITKRDYTFETPLTGSYANNTLSIPLTLGLKWKITERFQGRIYGTYNTLLSDWVDGVSDDNKKDSYFNAGFSLHYILRKKQEREDLYKDVDFKAIDKSDADNDGVKDINDDCQNTPKNIKVNRKGCPIDSDKDGVPDYKDKEPNSAKGVNVDEEGRTITDELIQKRIEERNKIITERKTSFSEEASTKTLDNIFEDIKERLEDDNVESKKIGENMPERLRSVDTNKDGLISTQEMNAAFDAFFEGTNDFTVNDLHKLVDYFFEQ